MSIGAFRRLRLKHVLSMWWVALPLSLATVTFATGPIVDLKITQAFQDLSTLQWALDNYKAKHGSLPTEHDGLTALIEPPLFRIPADPWGQPYEYRRPDGADSYLIYSRGVDGRDDGGLGDDVVPGAKTYSCADYGVNCAPTLRQVVVSSSLLICTASLFVGLLRMAQALRRSVRSLVERW